MDFNDLPLNGLRCPACWLPQRDTPSGASCPNGHGGEQGVDDGQDDPADEPIRRTIVVVNLSDIWDAVINHQGSPILRGDLHRGLPVSPDKGVVLMRLRHFCDHVRDLDEDQQYLDGLAQKVATYVGYDNFIDIEG